MEGSWDAIVTLIRKEQLLPGRTAEAEWLAKARAKNGAANDEEEEDNVKPLEKAPERPKDPVKAMEGVMKRIKDNVLPTLNDVASSEQLPPPPRAQVRSRGQDMTLEDALQHLSSTALDSKHLKVQPTKSVDSIVNLAVERFSKL